jgi:hypothetical protein
MRRLHGVAYAMYARIKTTVAVMSVRSQGVNPTNDANMQNTSNGPLSKADWYANSIDETSPCTIAKRLTMKSNIVVMGLDDNKE